jgi:hypothetical protein
MTRVGELALGQAVNTALDAVLTFRVWLHEQRAAGDIGVEDYTAGLRSCREAERAFEVVRESKGAKQSRAFEVAIEQIGRRAHIQTVEPLPRLASGDPFAPLVR